ncbi:hypothetical protein Q9R19_01425 [Microbacterium sp. ARD32]|uniref:hypothetical protein n=1 Tax=Microbacterium sp. ARD32 TaxID=2962577 RepID=UPI0028828C37|nr:hypothetical protein [Microbacterium sp. ARD32]MDT0156277.1 hypothetical protein [Microbacterium sp. ARD32]
MESEARMPREEAARALRAAEAVQARAAGVPRGHAVLQLLHAVMMSAYMAVFVYTGSDAVDTETAGGMLMMLVLPPIVISSGLVSGAGERYAGRLRAGRRYWLAVGVFLAMLLVLMAWRILGGGYPVWVVAVSAAVTLVIFAARPISSLRRADTGVRAEVPAVPLPHGVRVTTVMIGAGFGGACATVFLPTAGWLVVSALMLFTIMALAGSSSWSLRSTGWCWGGAQWTAFGASSAILFALAVLLIATDAVSPVVPVAMGAVIAASLVGVAFLPGRGEGEDDFAHDEGAGDGAPEA